MTAWLWLGTHEVNGKDVCVLVSEREAGVRCPLSPSRDVPEGWVLAHMGLGTQRHWRPR